MKQSVSVYLSEFACQAVAGDEAENLERVAEMVARAVRCYIGDAGSSGSGWSYPSFAEDGDPGGGVEVRLSIDEDLWHSLEEEAERQGVSTQQLVRHAALWFAAEVDAGRVTQRIIDGLGETSGEEGPTG